MTVTIELMKITIGLGPQETVDTKILSKNKMQEKLSSQATSVEGNGHVVLGRDPSSKLKCRILKLVCPFPSTDLALPAEFHQSRED